MVSKFRVGLVSRVWFLLLSVAFGSSPFQEALANSVLINPISKSGGIEEVQFSSGGGQGGSDCDAQKDQITSEGEQKVAATDPNDQCAVAKVIEWKEEQELAWAQTCAPDYVDQLQQAQQQASDQEAQACQ